MTTRAAIDLATPLLPKVNGAYYLVQVRALLETGRLAFADFPAVFLLEAGLARLLASLGVAVDSAIMVVVKAVDIALPPLAALPVIYLANRFRAPGDPRRWPAAVAGVFSVLSWSPLIMTGDFQKNAVGMLAMALTIAFGYAALSGGGLMSWLLAATSLATAGLSHAGAFAATAAFVILAALAAVALSRPGRWKAALAAISILFLGAVILGAVFWASDRERFVRMAGLALDPISLFRRPILVAAASGVVSPLDVLNSLLFSTVGVLGVVVLARGWRGASRSIRAIVGAATVLSLFLASPFIGAEWAERLSLMAYLPGSVALAYVLWHFRFPFAGKAVSTVGCVVIAVGLATSIGPLGMPSIPVESVRELEEMRGLVKAPERTLLIARHGLEWWAAWTLRVKVSQEFDLDPGVWGEYEEVFMLRQKPLEGPRTPGGPNGSGGRPFPEVRLSDDAVVVHDGRFFILAVAPTPPAFYPLARPER